MRPINYLLFISALCLCFNAQATVERFSILNSSAQAYKKGDIVSGSQTIELRKGEKLQIKSLVTEKKCDIIGPYFDSLKCAKPIILIADRIRPRQRSLEIAPPSVWALDFQRNSNFCYQHPEDLKLWRSDAAHSIRLEIKNFASTEHVRLRWPATQELINWPAKKLPLTGNNTYVFTVQGNAIAINFYQQPTHLQDQDEVRQWMQRQGCAAQLSMLQVQENTTGLFVN